MRNETGIFKQRENTSDLRQKNVMPLYSQFNVTIINASAR